ncbi:SRPBCC family protein [Alsobacter sp. KACC 23698]|uniref:SRPBCC family protein n=1 Tax=Alsobacter sp. KACC 23698 TaxID=3149229 RepID=A0AAU7JFS9_9HYPH
MDAGRQSDPTVQNARTTVERTSERELVVSRSVNGPAPIVFEAWSTPELFQRWWAPKSFGVSLISFEADVRSGGTYRLVMGHPSSEKPMAFFGRYIEVTPHSRLVWTNDEGGEDGAVTTVTFEEKNGSTRVIVHELYPSKEALDDAMASGSTSGWSEQFEQLDGLLVILDQSSDGHGRGLPKSEP